MRLVLGIVVALALVLGFVGGVAADKAEKETKLEGKITCPKCDLKKDQKCGTVIVVKADGKEAIYYFDADAHKKYHGEICQGGKAGTVTGTVSEKDGKKTVKVAKLEWSDD